MWRCPARGSGAPTRFAAAGSKRPCCTCDAWQRPAFDSLTAEPNGGGAPSSMPLHTPHSRENLGGGLGRWLQGAGRPSASHSIIVCVLNAVHCETHRQGGGHGYGPWRRQGPWQLEYEMDRGHEPQHGAYGDPPRREQGWQREGPYGRRRGPRAPGKLSDVAYASMREQQAARGAPPQPAGRRSGGAARQGAPAAAAAAAPGPVPVGAPAGDNPGERCRRQAGKGRMSIHGEALLCAHCLTTTLLDHGRRSILASRHATRPPCPHVTILFYHAGVGSHVNAAPLPPGFASKQALEALAAAGRAAGSTGAGPQHTPPASGGRRSAAGPADSDVLLHDVELEDAGEGLGSAPAAQQAPPARLTAGDLTADTTTGGCREAAWGSSGSTWQAEGCMQGGGP